MARVFPRITATRLQSTTYLLGIALFSISFLVFLNSTISFVVTSVVGQKDGVGNAVGTLGFADELLAVVACPLWGLLSDRIGVRAVSVLGYCIVGLSLICLVQSTNVYPDLLISRLGFSLGGAACSTMVTAVLPAMVADRSIHSSSEVDDDAFQRTSGAQSPPNGNSGGRVGIRHTTSPSLSSELTITPTRFSSQQRRLDLRGRAKTSTDSETVDKAADTSQLAGLVGLFTGAGALLALAVFLPLPAYLEDRGQTQAGSIRSSYYIVAAISFCVAVFIFIGLRNLPGEENRGWRGIFRTPYGETTKIDPEGHLHTTISPVPTYLTLITEAVKLGFTDSAIGLGYLGGFVARASSVAISLFIPLFVNAYFIRMGYCDSDPDDLTDIKEHCARAYTLAAALSGIAETAALICAPLFGVLAGRAARHKSEWPLVLASAIGILGYTGLGLLRNPDAFHGKGGQWAFPSVICIGISQIGAIVCSLGLLGRGIHKTTHRDRRDGVEPSGPADDRLVVEGHGLEGAEAAPLLPGAHPVDGTSPLDRSRLKGTIAGVYSLGGGAGILLLTKLGGALFDSWHTGAPFFLMAIFNGLLLVAILAVTGGTSLLQRLRPSQPDRRAD